MYIYISIDLYIKMHKYVHKFIRRYIDDINIFNKNILKY